MDRYEQLAVVGEGSYGLVMRCKHKDTEQIVAIKKFLETEEDATVRKMALREIRMLKRLKHENLVTMIEVFRYRKRFYLVFEYLEGTVLDELEKVSGGLDEETCRERIFQVTRAVNFCHMNNVIHRDIKPENVLVSSQGVVKLCDFGFARIVSLSGEQCTGYVATRWYRAPELLVNDSNYGSAVDVWSIGCLYAEMMTGDPLFPGDSDIDQLYLTIRLLGKPCLKHLQLMSCNTQMRPLIKSASTDTNGLQKLFPRWQSLSLDFLASCLKMDPQSRHSADELLKHGFFTHDRFVKQYLPKLREKIIKEFNDNPLLRKLKSEVLSSTDKCDRCEETKLRRSSQCDPPKWRLNISEGSVKRKFSCDTSASCDIIAPKPESNQSLTKQTSLQSMIKEKASKEGLGTPKNLDFDRPIRTPSKTVVKLLEKNLESLSKMFQKTERTMSSTRPVDSPTRQSPVVSPKFQSLQPLTFEPKSPMLSHHSQNVLHPSISNIGFCKDLPKKSPLQAVQNTSIKSMFHQIPLVNPPKGQQFLRKVDKHIYFENIVSNVDCNPNTAGSVWHQSTKSNDRKYKVKKEDEFTLPNLPCALTPNNLKKKGQMSPDSLIAQAITPRYNSPKALQPPSPYTFTNFF
ncbi:hypothetical protein RN001_013605 [Aquatica leii]|uniref:cyclin-dependent kinase n=1 Tax=Aquatica leii TaxID=1421715 RepID=A0AAN7SNT1_9COLE|nr:hypothetical protein RN001_013605 [Aquatica leii]